MTEPLSQAEYARKNKVSRQAINDLVSRGIIALDESGKIDPDLADIAIRNNINPAKSKILAEVPPENESNTPDQETSGITSFHVARSVRESFMAKLAELEYLEKSKQLVDPELLMAEFKQMAVAFREELISRDEKLKSEIAAIYNIDVDIQIFNAYTIDALAQFSRYAPESHTFDPG